MRAGVHMGEVVERAGALRGIAVHLAARAMSKAAGDEVVATATVKDIVAGSALRFDDRAYTSSRGSTAHVASTQ